MNRAPATVTANTCLAEMIRKDGQVFSLLPVGLTKIAGSFGKGDMVQIIDESGQSLAVGIARCDATTLRSMLGKKRQPVFIHYDQLHKMAD